MKIFEYVVSHTARSRSLTIWSRSKLEWIHSAKYQLYTYTRFTAYRIHTATTAMHIDSAFNQTNYYYYYFVSNITHHECADYM